jgi:ferredoxin-NADP reductase
MAMLRHRAAMNSNVPTTLLYSSRSFEDIIYQQELGQLAGTSNGLKIVHTLTRKRPSAETVPRAASTVLWLRRTVFRPMRTRASSSAARHNSSNVPRRSRWPLGNDRNRIKTERFGPTGG